MPYGHLVVSATLVCSRGKNINLHVDVASPHVVVFIHSTLHYGHSNQEFIIMKGAKEK